MISLSQELPGVATVPMAGTMDTITEDHVMSPVTYTQQSDVMEPESAADQEPGCGGEERSVTLSLSSSSGDEEQVTVTPPRDEPFIYNPRRRVYTDLNNSVQAAYREITGEVTGNDNGDN